MEVRRAAKGLITYSDGSIVVVKGAKSGRWNLVGGGIKTDETPEQAFRREADEEIVDFIKQIGNLNEQTGIIRGEITTAKGIKLLAAWTLFKAELQSSPTDLQIANPDEISAITTMTFEQCLAEQNMSMLAVQAISRYLNPDLIPDVAC